MFRLRSVYVLDSPSYIFVPSEGPVGIRMVFLITTTRAKSETVGLFQDRAILFSVVVAERELTFDGGVESYLTINDLTELYVPAPFLARTFMVVVPSPCAGRS